MVQLIERFIRTLAKTLGWSEDQDPEIYYIPTVKPIEQPKSMLTELYPTWEDPKHAFHNTRVLCDRAGLTVNEKDLLCACIFQESEFRIHAVGPPNHNGTIDYGLCQYNNGTIKGIPLWIGKGAAFASIQDVLTNPQKNVEIMIKTYKAGHLNWWASYSTGAYRKWLPHNSRMWLLKT